MPAVEPRQSAFADHRLMQIKKIGFSASLAVAVEVERAKGFFNDLAMLEVVIGPQTDKLRRFYPIGWYGIMGFGVYRNDALYRIESDSSIA